MPEDKPGITTDKPKSWRSTACGIAAAVGALCLAATALLDDDPTTKVDIASLLKHIGPVLMALGVAGAGVFSKDHKVHG
jgi:hypothetical protein